MAKIDIIHVSREEWKRLTEKYGNAAVDKVGNYEDLKSDDYLGYFVARGKYTPEGSTTEQPTEIGYLQKGNDVDGWVGQLP